MFTKEQIKSALENGTIRLVHDPDLDNATVISIGDANNEFLFNLDDGNAAELMPEEYLRCTPMEDVIEEVYAALYHYSSNGNYLCSGNVMLTMQDNGEYRISLRIDTPAPNKPYFTTIDRYTSNWHEALKEFADFQKADEKRMKNKSML